MHTTHIPNIYMYVFENLKNFPTYVSQLLISQIKIIYRELQRKAPMQGATKESQKHFTRERERAF